ncbi:hypothetical protein S7335_4777 [Synechococcus sp. PCC 7335]|uniref:hypothetical protein n=1 Tax=Synechococcus sp. (strain ATCC 29403 / PCC 7335) TaxID=91464 RepID=UPI00017ECB17|nr:hypothetical protein [Synechococcus sp. PCC 7335]EDX87070.1 hypothetical protein S7335_4777 [Synechococcus sp. PCC 7335]
MILNTSRQPFAQQNHRKPWAIRSLQWFWRFSQFYGEYTVRSPQERQQWISQQRNQHQRNQLSN